MSNYYDQLFELIEQPHINNVKSQLIEQNNCKLQSIESSDDNCSKKNIHDNISRRENATIINLMKIKPEQLQCNRLQKYKPNKKTTVCKINDVVKKYNDATVEHNTNVENKNTNVENKNITIENKDINKEIKKDETKTIEDINNVNLMIDGTDSINEEEAYRQLFMINYSGSDFGSAEYNTESNNPILTDMIPTTVTVKASLSNIYFNEKDMINRLEPDINIKGIKSNYGEKFHSSYVNTKEKKKSNRGRKKIEKDQNKRKPQGSGKAFNSQTSLLIECSGKMYPIKVFRNGNLQFPGSSQKHFKDMMQCFKFIIDKFNNLLYNDRPLVQLTSLEPAMKNYKYSVKMSEGYILYLEELRICLEKERNTSDIVIHSINYGKDQSKLKLIFDTPSESKSDKLLHINIFRSGKINVLGGLDENYTLKSYNFIKHILGKYYDKIVYHPQLFDVDDKYEYVYIKDWNQSDQGRVNKKNALLTSMGYWD